MKNFLLVLKTCVVRWKHLTTQKKMPFRGLGAFFLLVFLNSCTSSSTPKKTLTKQEEQVLQKNTPAWVREKPISSLFYTGIGYSAKQVNDYQQVAKQKALEDLSSEIKVSVSATSLLYQMDSKTNSSNGVNSSFKESYEASTKVKSQTDFENFELVGTHEDETGGYWLYYRLSKEEYKSQQEKKRNDAQKIALNFYEKAQNDQKSGKIIPALDNYISAIMAIEKYWNEANEVQYQGKNMMLGTSVYSNIQDILDNIRLKTSQTTIIIQKNLPKIPFEVFYKTQKLPNLPIKALFTEGRGELARNYITDNQGNILLNLQKLRPHTKNHQILVEADLTNISPTNAQNAVFALFLSRLRVPNTNIILEKEKQIAYIISKEKNLNISLQNAPLSRFMKELLTKRGISITENPEKATFWLEIDTNTEANGINNDIYNTLLNLSVRGIEPSTKNEFFSHNKPNLKGFQIKNFTASGLDAHKRAEEYLEEEILPKILEEIGK